MPAGRHSMRGGGVRGSSVAGRAPVSAGGGAAADSIAVWAASCIRAIGQLWAAPRGTGGAQTRVRAGSSGAKIVPVRAYGPRVQPATTGPSTTQGIRTTT